MWTRKKRKKKRYSRKDDVLLKNSKLFEENLNLIYSFAKKYSLDLDEFRDTLVDGLVNASEKYDPSISKFSTFAYSCMKSKMINHFRLKKKQIPKELMNSLNDENFTKNNLSVLESKQNVESEVVFKMNFMEFLDGLPPDEKKVILMLIQGHSKTYIAKTLHMNPSTIKRMIVQIRRKWIDNKQTVER